MKNKYLILQINGPFDQLQGAEIFSKFDLRSGYHQLGINLKDISKTTSRTGHGLYTFTVMHYDLTNAPMGFVDHMNGVLDPIYISCDRVYRWHLNIL